MSNWTLRKHLMKIGRWAVMLGAMLCAGGLWLGSPLVLGAGCVTILGGAYTMVYAHVGSY
jgi:hypothetical protein